MARATYDLTTAIGRVRFLISDKVPASAIFKDTEIDAALTMAASKERLAAAICLESAASNAAKLAKIVKLGTLGINKVTVFQALIEMAKHFRTTGGYIPAVSAPDAMITLAKDGVAGNLDGV